MASVTLKGNKIHTSGELPKNGETAKNFELVKGDLSRVTLNDFKGKRVIMNIFPSLDTDTCATSVKQFNERATQLENTEVLCISRDTPFAQNRFADDADIKNVTNLSDIVDGKFGKDYGLDFVDGPLKGLNSRAVIVLDENHNVIYTEQVPEIADEPDYLSALKSLV